MNIVKKPEKPRMQPLRGGGWKCKGRNWEVLCSSATAAYARWQRLSKDGAPRVQMVSLNIPMRD